MEIQRVLQLEPRLEICVLHGYIIIFGPPIDISTFQKYLSSSRVIPQKPRNRF